MKSQQRLARQWQILAAISRTRRGLSLVELMELTGKSKPTTYRDLQVLMEVGIPLRLEAGRYRFLSERELPPLGFNAAQIAALHLARAQLQPLEGAPAVTELDRLLAKLREPAQQCFRFKPSHKALPSAEVVKTIERALRYRRRARIEYRAASRAGAATNVSIEPLLINVADGDPYLRAYCVERREERTYKLSRVCGAVLTDELATYRPAATPGQAFEHSLKAWSGELHKVRIRLDRSVAWLAREYPLPGQVERTSEDGAVTVEATVAGLVEAKRRILAWGSAAEVLAPKQLRRAVRDELAAALGRYDGPGPARAGQAATEKSTTPPNRVLRDRETRAG